MRQSPAPPPSGVTPPPDDRPGWETTAGKILLCLFPVALGVFGLIAGTSVILIPGGNQPGQPLMWSVSGSLGRVVAFGLLGIGLGGLAKMRASGKSPVASWAIGVGVFLTLGGSLVHGVATVVTRWVGS